MNENTMCDLSDLSHLPLAIRNLPFTIRYVRRAGCGNCKCEMIDESEHISQDEINSTPARGCHTFRVTVDPSEYENYILVMLFVEHISGVGFAR